RQAPPSARHIPSGASCILHPASCRLHPAACVLPPGARISCLVAMYPFRTSFVVAVLFLLVCSDLPAQKKKPADDEGYVPMVAPDTKKKKKEDTQTLPPPKELPIA